MRLRDKCPQDVFYYDGGGWILAGKVWDACALKRFVLNITQG